MLSQFLEAPQLQQNHISCPQRLKINAERSLTHLGSQTSTCDLFAIPMFCFLPASRRAQGYVWWAWNVLGRGWSRVSELPLSLGLFSDLDTHSHLGVITYGVSMTTLEDVYLKLEVEAEIDQAGGKEGAELCPWLPQLWAGLSSCGIVTARRREPEKPPSQGILRSSQHSSWKYSAWKPGEGREWFWEHPEKALYLLIFHPASWHLTAWLYSLLAF